MNILNRHDHEIYEKMRFYAESVFDLELISVYIPSQTLEQGEIDILKILRNI